MSAMNPIQASQISGDVKAHCNKYMNYHVIAHMKDGSQIEGIIDGMDNEGVTMLVPEEVGGEGRETIHTDNRLVTDIAGFVGSIFRFFFLHFRSLDLTRTTAHFILTILGISRQRQYGCTNRAKFTPIST